MVQPVAGRVVPHMRLTWGGDLGVPPLDIWSNGLAWSVTGEAPSAAELATIASSVAGSIQDFHTNINSQFGNAASLKWIKAVWLLGDGSQRDTNTAVYDFPLPHPRGNKTTNPIWEQTYVVTLRTALQRGRGHSGRIYPPLCGPLPEGNTPYAPAGFAADLALNFKTMVTQMENTIGQVLGNVGGRNPDLVISSRSSADWPVPILTKVTSCVVDRVPDIQHRRVNRVPRLEGATEPIA